jgi:hypothetical protein
LEWQEVPRIAEGIARTGSDPPSPDVLRNLRRLCLVAAGRYPAPVEVARGYWPTIRLCWTNLRPKGVEIEVFASRFELYRFAWRETEIDAYPVLSSEPVPLALLSALDRCFSGVPRD